MMEHTPDTGDAVIVGGIVLALSLWALAMLGALYALVRFIRWAWG